MIHFLYHYVYQDIYQVAYSNWIAGAVVAPLAFLWGKAFERRSIKRHNEMKAHITQQHDISRINLRTQLNDLHKKMDKLENHILSEPEEEEGE